MSIRQGAIYLRELGGAGAERRLAAAEPGESAVRWSADGKWLFTSVLEPDSSAFRVYRLEVSTGRKVLWKRLRPPDTVGVGMTSVVVTPDGGSYVYSYQRDLSDLFVITGLR